MGKKKSQPQRRVGQAQSTKQFQIKVDAAERLFLDALYDVRAKIGNGYIAGTPITLIVSSFDQSFVEGSQWCIREWFGRLLGIGEQFPNEVGTNRAKWARSLAAGVIRRSVRGTPFSRFRQELLSLLGREADEALLRQPVYGQGSSDEVQRTGGAKFISPAQGKHEEALQGPQANIGVRASQKTRAFVGGRNGTERGAAETKTKRGNERKGDPALLEGKDRVTFRTAEQYLGMTERQRQNLVRQGSLIVEGRGQNRKITTESLRKYLPPEHPKRPEATRSDPKRPEIGVIANR